MSEVVIPLSKTKFSSNYEFFTHLSLSIPPATQSLIVIGGFIDFPFHTSTLDKLALSVTFERTAFCNDLHFDGHQNSLHLLYCKIGSENQDISIFYKKNTSPKIEHIQPTAKSKRVRLVYEGLSNVDLNGEHLTSLERHATDLVFTNCKGVFYGLDAATSFSTVQIINCDFTSFSPPRSRELLKLTNDNLKAAELHIRHGNIAAHALTIPKLSVGPNAKVQLHNCRIDESSFHGKHAYPLSLEKSIFTNPPDFTDTEQLNKNCIFSGVQFENLSHEDAELRFRVLRTLSEKNGNEHDKFFFHAYELRARYLNVLKKEKLWGRNGLERISSCFMYRLNGHGLNTWKPLIAMLVLLLLGFAAYMLLGVTINQSKLADAPYICNLPAWCQSLIYSARATLGPFAILLNETPLMPTTIWGKLATVLHQMFATLLWYLAIVTVRRRFSL